MISDQYTAAFIDAEGCIRITVQKARSGKRRSASRSHRLVMELVNVHPGVILLLRDRWGGRVDFRTKNRNTPLFVWRIWSRDAAGMLAQILPHMIVKHDEAVLALEFMDKGEFQRSGRTRRLTAEVLELRESYKTRIANMHSRKGAGEINSAYAAVQEEAFTRYGL